MASTSSTTTIKAWGNSAAVRLPVHLLDQAGLTLDQPVELRVDRQGLSIRADRSRPDSRPTFVHSPEIEQWRAWARAATPVDHPDGFPLVIRVRATDAAVSLDMGPGTPQDLEQLPRMSIDRLLSVGFHVLADRGSHPMLDLGRPQHARLRLQLEDHDGAPTVTWVWRSHPTPDGAVITLRPATLAHGYRLGQGDRDGTLAELQAVLDQARWAALGEDPVPLERSVLPMVAALGRITEPTLTRDALLELAARALVAVEALDTQTGQTCAS